MGLTRRVNGRKDTHFHHESAASDPHFKGLVNHYSPHNEPGITCQFCGLLGIWPPYHRNIQSWTKIGVGVAKGMVLEMAAIREALPDAVIVSVDPFFYGIVEPHLPPAKIGDPARLALARAAAFYPASLAYGKLTADHPFAEFLRNQGIGEAELAWFDKCASKPDILGCNLYPGMHEPPRPGKPVLSVEQVARNQAQRVKNALLDSQTYFNLPVYLTETSAGLTDEAKIAYINALDEMVQELRGAQVPIVGVNWWPLFDTIQWDYRDKPNKPLADFIYPGGWNNGLYKIKPEPNGDLRRVATGAVQAYQNVLGRELTKGQ